MQVAIRPAKPFAFGLVGDTPVFGLPGNPVSSMVSYEVLARPGLRRMAGRADADLRRPAVPAIVDDSGCGGAGDGRTTSPGSQVDMGADGRYHVRSAGGQGSHQLHAMALADGLAIVPAGVGRSAAGDDVPVLLLGPVGWTDGGIRRSSIRYDRTVRDLRISITDRCNFRCHYCMPDEGMKWLPRDELLTYEELDPGGGGLRASASASRASASPAASRRSGPTSRSWSSRLADLGVDLAMTTNGATLAAPGRRSGRGPACAASTSPATRCDPTASPPSPGATPWTRSWPASTPPWTPASIRSRSTAWWCGVSTTTRSSTSPPSVGTGASSCASSSGCRSTAAGTGAWTRWCRPARSSRPSTPCGR